MIFKTNETIYTQIADYLKRQIFSEKYKKGEKLPPIRELAITTKVNPNTIVRVYQELSEEGIIYTDSTNGKFVTEDINFLNDCKNNYIREKMKKLIEDVKECNFDKKEMIKLLEELLNG